MKALVLSVFLALALNPIPVNAYKILYAEQFYRLYHKHFYEDPTRAMENIFWLERSLRADFANPLNAMAKINTPKEWERYRYLFYTHVSLILIDQYLILGKNYDKFQAYFYNSPWKTENLKSLDKAERVYEFAKVYWEEAKQWSKKATALSFINLPEVQYWADRSWRIENGELDYGFIIDRHLTRLRGVRRDFEAMNENTY